MRYEVKIDAETSYLELIEIEEAFTILYGSPNSTRLEGRIRNESGWLDTTEPVEVSEYREHGFIVTVEDEDGVNVAFVPYVSGVKLVIENDWEAG